MSRGGIALKKFEPKKPEKEVISLRLDSRMLEEINSWAIEIDISRNEFINQCIDFALKNILIWLKVWKENIIQTAEADAVRLSLS